ncbi:MAG: hypothetical protein RJQ08_14520 [Salinisphaeraceae bacterium]
MTQGPVVALALATTLDPDAARHLHDFDGLDEAGIERAVTTLCQQRHGNRALPWHLQRLDAAAWVTVTPDTARIHAASVADGQAEAELLEQLNALLSDAAVVAAWAGERTWPLLRARAARHGRASPWLWPAGGEIPTLVDVAGGFGPAGDSPAPLLREWAALLGAPLISTQNAALCQQEALDTAYALLALQVARGDRSPAEVQACRSALARA